MLAVVATGRSNLLSVRNALDYLGAKHSVCAEAGELEGAERIVLPGVGAFRDGMGALRDRGLVEPLDAARAAGVPILGICLGMQLLGRTSDEGGLTDGLGWIAGDVRRLDPAGLRVPHVGWNETTPRETSPLFRGVPRGAELYYVHSFQLVCDDEETVDATVDYGGPVTAAVRHDNVAGVQFHPEKSQEHGLAVLDAFLRWDP